MSRFFSPKLAKLEAYVPGEQPQDRQYIKLNTNESPYPPRPAVLEAARQEAGRNNLYCDPECRRLQNKLAQVLGVGTDNLLLTNGSDEALNFAVLAFGDSEHSFCFADITYGFYPVFCQVNQVPYELVPLRPDFSINPADYRGKAAHIILANPNAPTGIALSPEAIEPLIAENPNRLVVVDEAYVDFGAESCLPLISKYDNLLVVQTFSKSRSMAGGRLGFAVGAPALIADLNTIKYSTNPYNINRMTQGAGLAVLEENEYYMDCCRTIAQTREVTAAALGDLGFAVLPSKTNFLFARHPAISGETLYLALREQGVLIRHFSNPAIADYNRITIGTPEQMQVFLEKCRGCLKERA